MLVKEWPFLFSALVITLAIRIVGVIFVELKMFRKYGFEEFYYGYVLCNVLTLLFAYKR